ncbi:RNHCP domain-containing protein [bacterium]|nr:RNHCP domain-containing protein [bacterium]
MSFERKNFIVPEREPFVCEHCGAKVMGGRYVDHCPQCLWSKHVDEKTPGDRASLCGGLMEPIGVIQKHGRWRITYRCLKCGIERIVDTAPGDNFVEIIRLSQIPLQKEGKRRLNSQPRR